MHVDKEIYAEANLTTWGYEVEALVVHLAKVLAAKRGWDTQGTVRMLNMAALSGGESGQPRSPITRQITVGELQGYAKKPLPASGHAIQFKSYNATTFQAKLLRGE
jgi:hypothetical protein